MNLEKASHRHSPLMLQTKHGMHWPYHLISTLLRKRQIFKAIQHPSGCARSSESKTHAFKGKERCLTVSFNLNWYFSLLNAKLFNVSWFGENNCFGAIFLSVILRWLSYCIFPAFAFMVFQSEDNEKRFFFLSRIKAKHRRCQMINIWLWNMKKNRKSCIKGINLWGYPAVCMYFLYC